MASKADNDAMTAAEAAVMLHMGVKKLYELIHDGSLPALILGRRYLLSRSRIHEMLRTGNVVTAADDVAPEPSDAPRS